MDFLTGKDPSKSVIKLKLTEIPKPVQNIEDAPPPVSKPVSRDYIHAVMTSLVGPE